MKRSNQICEILKEQYTKDHNMLSPSSATHYSSIFNGREPPCGKGGIPNEL